MRCEIELKPAYVACVSGGKASLLMLQVIIKNRDKYPLDYVVHYELEIDYPFINDVVNEMESMCKKIGVPLIRIKPRRSWESFYEQIVTTTGNKRGFPTRQSKWCNGHYKMDAMRQMQSWLKSQNRIMYSYIGFCADELKRCKNRR